MNSYADHKCKSKNLEVSSNPAPRAAEVKSIFQLKDNRPQANHQKKQVENLLNKESGNIIQQKTNKTGLPAHLKAGIENLSGHSMDDVKVHYNSDKPAQLNAHAYAQGTQIHIASGQEKHLPHEAWHVVQQKQGRVKPTMQMKGIINVNDDKRLEKEADTMGAKAAQGVHQRREDLKSSSGIANSNAVQRKVGVEYETTWNITGNNKQNHKQTVINGAGWHMETDNNNLEFVVFPPANSPEQLRSTVGNMAVTAGKIKSKSGEFATKDAGTLLGDKVDQKFRKENFKVGKDATMSAKAQFSFGISMENLTKLFDSLSTGLPESKAATKNKTFNFVNPNPINPLTPSAPTTTRNFLMNSVKADVQKSSAYRAGMKELSGANSPDLQGFLAYLSYSVKAMEATYSEKVTAFITLTEMNKAAMLAQEIVKEKLSPKTIGDVITQLGYNQATLFNLMETVTEADDFEEDTKLTAINGTVIAKLEEFKVRQTEDGMDFPKYRFTFMNRTGFDKMYQSLSAADQKWFRDNIDEVLAKMGRKPDSRLFASPYSYKTKKNKDDSDTKVKGFSHGPTIKEWLISIIASTPKKRDLMSPPKEFIMGNGEQDSDQSLGLLAKMDTSEVTQYGFNGAKPQLFNAETKKVKQVIIELRSWGDYIKPEDWANHSYDMAYLFSEIAKGDLTQKEQVEKDAAFAAKLNPLLVQKNNLQANLTKKFSDNKGQKTNQKNNNRSIRNKIGAIDAEIHKIRVERNQ